MFDYIIRGSFFWIGIFIFLVDFFVLPGPIFIPENIDKLHWSEYREILLRKGYKITPGSFLARKKEGGVDFYEPDSLYIEEINKIRKISGINGDIEIGWIMVCPDWKEVYINECRIPMVIKFNDEIVAGYHRSKKRIEELNRGGLFILEYYLATFLSITMISLSIFCASRKKKYGNFTQ